MEEEEYNLLKKYRDDQTFAVIGAAMAVHRELGPGTLYKADFVCYGGLIIEMKTVETITDVHRSQLIHYLKAIKIKKGLLINFKNKSLQYERFANDY